MGLQDTTSGFKAVVLTADSFEDMEVFFPLFRLFEHGDGRQISLRPAGRR